MVDEPKPGILSQTFITYPYFELELTNLN